MSKKLKYKPGDLVKFNWDGHHPMNFLRVLRHEGFGDYMVHQPRFNKNIRVNAWNTEKVVDAVPEELLWD